MEKQKHIIEGMTKQIIKKIVDQEVYEWPPRCPTFYYQPVRPSKMKRETDEKRKQTSANSSAN